MHVPGKDFAHMQKGTFLHNVFTSDDEFTVVSIISRKGTTDLHSEKKKKTCVWAYDAC